MGKPELVAPAGNLEKLEAAILYGADAVYLAGRDYGLRTGADNFTMEEMEQGLKSAHSRGRRVYAAVNIFAHNEDLEGTGKYLRALQALGMDGVIVSDPGILALAREFAPRLPVHLSTQANCTNWGSARFWSEAGCARIILARELSLEELKAIRNRVYVQLEAFVHGAMCVSYSGRCLLSNFLVGRDANRGDCAHPCRWRYHLMEENREGEYFPVFEDERGTAIMNSHDLCMLEHIPELVQAGVDCFKIEGRMKSVHYVATVVKAYRQAIDSYAADPSRWVCRAEWLEEVEKVSHRAYSTGFFFGRPDASSHSYEDSGYIRSCDYVAKVLEYDADGGTALVEQKNRFQVGDEIEVLTPEETPFNLRILSIEDEDGNALESAPHPLQHVRIPMDRPVPEGSLLRRYVRE